LVGVVEIIAIIETDRVVVVFYTDAAKGHTVLLRLARGKPFEGIKT
jgi:hypothetical protein